MRSARHTGNAASKLLDRFQRGRLKATILFLSACLSGHAQSVQTLPEIDVNVTINDLMRAYLQAKDDRDGGAPNQFSIGPSMQLYLKPILRLKRITEFDLDDSKARPLVLEGGYRYVTAPNEPSTNRFEPMLTAHSP